ncbi:MAG: hypothetical protein Fur0037_01340 [Planctomycetota bacterium]
MPPEPKLGPTILERIDLTLADRLVGAAADADILASADGLRERLYSPSGGDARWIGSLLRLRGLLVLDEDVADVLTGNTARFPSGTQESCMIRGLHELLCAMRERGRSGRTPDGAFLREAFEIMTAGIARFRNNTLRRDQPWDSILYVSYPGPWEVEERLSTFDEAHRYHDAPSLFDGLHPARQAWRVLYRFARLSPFPDMNLPMAWVAMCSYLLARGYPILAAAPQDQGLLHRLIGGSPPARLRQFEGRLLEAVESL